MTFEDYTKAVDKAQAKHPEWRLGQTAFNVLWELRPDLSEQVRATEIDPFHSTARLPQFFAWVQERWDGAAD